MPNADRPLDPVEPTVAARLAAALHGTRHRRAWAWLLMLLMAVVAWFAFHPRPPEVVFENADKVNHVLAFGALATSAALAQAAGRRAVLITVLGLVGYGIFIELVQSFLPSRSAEALDVLADSVGIVGGLLLVALLRRLWPAPPG